MFYNIGAASVGVSHL